MAIMITRLFILLLFVCSLGYSQTNVPLLFNVQAQGGGGGDCDLGISSIIGCWTFSGDATDGSGNGYDGTVNGAALTTDRDANSNSAYDFNGSTDNIDFGDIDFNSLGTEFSVSGWFYFDVLNSLGVLMQATSNTDTQNSFYISVESDGDLRINIQNYNNANIDLGLSTSTWYHIVFTFSVNVSDQLDVEIYLNGSSVFTETSGVLSNPSAACLASDHFVIGSLGNGAGRFFNGIEDDLRIYDDILTSGNVTTLYNE